MKVSDNLDSQPEDGYVLARNAAEYQRLRVQARNWEEATLATFDKIGVGSGWHCLDVGCGPGEAMRLMGQRVGPTCRVVGLDSDASVGARAVADLTASGSAIYGFISANIATLTSIDGGPFDLVFARLFMSHMPSPEPVLAKLWSWVKAGGTLCVMDYDGRTVGSFPEDLASGKLWAVIWEALRKLGKHTTAGVRMPWLFETSGIGKADGTHYSGEIVSTSELAARDPWILISAMRDSILAHHISTESELAQLEVRTRAEFAAHAGYLVMPSMVSTWKRKNP